MSTAQTDLAAPSDRELVFARSFEVDRELVWKAWTDPETVARWWGPQGFTNTIHEMDVRPGGLWRLTMHGPDGVNFPNRIEFIDVRNAERLAYHHGDDANPQQFHVTTDFVAAGQRTKVVTRILFKTAAECDAIREFAFAGHSSSMSRLAKQLAQMESAANEIVSTRIFAAPRARVFAAFSDPKQLAQWWGPEDFTNNIQEFDLRPGGKWRMIMYGPNDTEFHNEKIFVEVIERERVVFDHLQPMHLFRMTMIFAERNGETELTWRMLFESGKEGAKLKVFIAAANEQNFDRLAAHLAKPALA